MVKGMSLDNELVALFMTALGDSPYFENVELAGDRGQGRSTACGSTSSSSAPRSRSPATRRRRRRRQPSAPAQARRARDDRDTRRAPWTSDSTSSGTQLDKLAQGPARRTAWRCCRWSRCWSAALYAYVLLPAEGERAREPAQRAAPAPAPPQRGARGRGERRASSRRRSRPSSASSRSRCASCRTARSCRCCSPTSTRSARTRASRSRPSGPSQEVKRDFYAEVPIEIEFIGRFHDIATFFDQVARLPRIVNVEQARHQDRRGERRSRRVLKVTGEAVTFRFLEESEQAPPAEAARRARARRATRLRRRRRAPRAEELGDGRHALRSGPARASRCWPVGCKNEQTGVGSGGLREAARRDHRAPPGREGGAGPAGRRTSRAARGARRRGGAGRRPRLGRRRRASTTRRASAIRSAPSSSTG